MSAVSPSETIPRRAGVWPGAAIALAAVLAYHGSFSGPFVFDDVPGILHNPSLRTWSNWLSPPVNTTVSGRPVVNLTLGLDYAISGTRVWSYHALNLAVHILAGLTLFGIVRRTLLGRSALSPTRWSASGAAQRVGDNALRPTFVAFAIAVLWTMHPLQTESVTYIIQRAESLMGLFYLLTLYCFIRFTEGRSAPAEGRSAFAQASANEEAGGSRWAWLSIICCLLGMATKEVMVSAPLIVLLYDRTFVAGTLRRAWKSRRGFYLGLAASWLVLVALVAGTGGRTGTAGFGTHDSWWAYALTQGGAIPRYLGLTLWPHPLIFDYGPQLAHPSAKIIAAALLVLAGLAGTVWAVGKRPALGFAGVWFFAILAPSSSVLPIATEAIAEHRMYLPLAAVVTLLVGALYRLAGKGGLLAAVALALAFGGVTARRNEDYRSSLALWTDTIARRPENPDAWCNRGIILDQLGRAPEAMEDFSEAVRLAPDDAEAHNDLAVDLEKSGRHSEALAHYFKALRLAPGYAEAHANLAAALADAARWSEAIAQYRWALGINPEDPIAEDGLGRALAETGHLSEAIVCFRKALKLDPSFAKAHYDWGAALAHAGQTGEAIAQDWAALGLDPGYAAAHTNLAIALDQTGKTSEAIAEFEAAVRLQPDSSAAHRNLGLALRSAGRAPEAEFQFAEVARLEAAKGPPVAPAP